MFVVWPQEHWSPTWESSLNLWWPTSCMMNGSRRPGKAPDSGVEHIHHCTAVIYGIYLYLLYLCCFLVCRTLTRGCRLSGWFVISYQRTTKPTWGQRPFIWSSPTSASSSVVCSHAWVVFSCRYLVKFLAKLAQDSELNKMTPSNIAIVLGPNLLWTKTEG